VSSFDIDFSSGAEFAQSLRRLTQQIQSSLEHLDQQIQPSLPHWEGSTREQYYQHKARWDQAAANMARGLAPGGRTIANIVELHTRTEVGLNSPETAVHLRAEPR
jgi:WXG100 family type VII secretion target